MSFRLFQMGKLINRESLATIIVGQVYSAIMGQDRNTTPSSGQLGNIVQIRYRSYN